MIRASVAALSATVKTSSHIESVGLSKFPPFAVQTVEPQCGTAMIGPYCLLTLAAQFHLNNRRQFVPKPPRPVEELWCSDAGEPHRAPSKPHPARRRIAASDDKVPVVRKVEQ